MFLSSVLLVLIIHCPSAWTIPCRLAHFGSVYMGPNEDYAPFTEMLVSETEIKKLLHRFYLPQENVTLIEMYKLYLSFL